MTQVNKVTLRFNFTNDIMDMITRFSKLHQFDDRNTYKEHWATWVETNKILLEAEVARLTAGGYEGDAKDKMYKAGRYYFRKKTNQGDAKANGDAKAKAKKRTYITMDKHIIEEMDKHIIAGIRNQQVNCVKYTPAKGYEDFCKQFEHLLLGEQERLLNKDTVNEKFKKTYKNRYFNTHF